MAKKRKELSQAEVWDDSALIRSWDDALEEYKLYHSIHARGERVEDVLKSAENGEQLSHRIELKGAQHETIARDVLSEDLEDGELDEGDEGGKTPSVLNCNILPGTEDQISSPVQQRHQQQSAEAKSIPKSNVASTTPDDSAVPSAMLGGVHDGVLKNLMMSWYYAGYYSGLYESQQKAQKPPNGEHTQHDNVTG